MNALRTEKRKSLNIPDTHIMNLLDLLKVSIGSIVSQCLYAKSETLAFSGRGENGQKSKAALPLFNAYIQCQRLFSGASISFNEYVMPYSKHLCGSLVYANAAQAVKIRYFME
jgi:hypothetical protein